MLQDAARRRRRIAVVAANEDLRVVISEILTSTGYAVTSFERTSDLLAGRRRHHPELIVLHPMHSSADGRTSWEDLARLLSHPTLGLVPVLVCSADVKAVRERAKTLAVDPRADALEMPFDIDALESAVQQLLDGAPVRGWDDMKELVLVADADGRLIDASTAALTVLGVTEHELADRSVADIVAANREWTDAEWARYVSDGSWSGDVVLRAVDGRELPAVASAEVVRLAGQSWHLSRLTLLNEPDPVAGT